MSLILSNDDVLRALEFDAAMAACETAYRELADGRAVNRPTSQTYLPHTLPRGTYSFKSVEGGVQAFGVMALRITSDVVREEEVSGTLRLNKVPVADGKFCGLVQIYSVETGALVAIMPDGIIQQARVAITSGLAMRAMAREDSHTLALVGTGDQARAHVKALRAARPFTRVQVYSPNPAHRARFVQEMIAGGAGAPGPLGRPACEVVATESVEACVAGADVICTATNASRAIVTGAHLRPGVHYNAIREFELDESVFEKADVTVIHTRFGGAHHYLPPGVNHLPGVRREKPRDWSRYPEIGELLVGRAAGRTRPDQITFFLNNIGTGVQFAAVGHSVLARARQLGLGHEVPTDWFLQDIKP